jgi:glutamate-1-semialdehyde 2,1-aminomutase
MATFGLPDSAGVPAAFARLTLVAPYNDARAAASLFRRHGPRIAGVIVEPVAGNMGVVPPEAGFLEALRSLCTQAGSLLIFDEVISGFRLGPGGAQEIAGVRPDLTTLGKVLGGGLPVGAYGGRKDLMALVAPSGPVYQAGTLSGNPLAMAAGIATLTTLDRAVYARMEALGARLQAGLEAAVASTGSVASVARAGSLLTLFFRSTPPRSFDEAKQADTARFARFHRAMLDRGIHLPPSQYEAWFVSAAHTEGDIDRTVAAARKSLLATAADGAL